MFLVHAPFSAESIGGAVGKADYSYFFVLRAYLPVLQSLGRVVELSDPAEADGWHEGCEARGEYCVLLCFAPPQRVPLTLRCPVVPVFAWEYDTLPDESWRHDRQTDWSLVLAKLGCAITHSEFAAEVVRDAIRPSYPVVSVPAPVWDRHAGVRSAAAPVAAPGARQIVAEGSVLDGRELDFAADASALLAAHPPAHHEIALDGVLYTAVFCPLDGRKNWEDLVTAFCWAFRENADCTLLLKLVHHDRDEALREVLGVLRRLPPCAARIVVLHAFLDEAQYLELLRATDFIVNASLGEGQCLPLMEYMSAGVPAIAPDHTAMRDYLDASCGFVLSSFQEWCHWPHDLRLVLRTLRHRPNWDSLVAAYRASRAQRLAEPEAYARMGQNARERLRNHCSQAVARERLEAFFRDHAAALAGARRHVSRKESSK